MHTRFTDTITFYHKEILETQEEGRTVEVPTWTRKVIHGVQWSDHFEKQDTGGRISVASYATLTLPQGTFEGLVINAKNEEDAIVYGEVDDIVTTVPGHRVSDLLNKYQRGGRIKSVNDNSNRTHLKNIKVVLG